MYRKTPFRLIWLLLYLFVTSGCEPRPQLVEQHLLQFGTIIEITMITDDLKQAEQLLVEIENQLQAQHNQWHAWEESDLTRFNAALQQGFSTRIPATLASLLNLSSEYFEATGGLFNPALGKLIGAYGFHGSEADFDTIDAIKRNVPGMHNLKIDGDFAISNNPNLQIDFGGIAKGYALGLISQYLDRHGIDSYIINAGGDIAIAGDRFGRPWRIGIKNPYAPGAVASIEISGKHNLFTSGNYERQNWYGRQMAHHIIDPRSGNSSTGQSSATVLSGDPVRADVAATAMMIAGLQGQPNLPQSLSIDDYLLVDETRKILVSRSLLNKINVLVSWPVHVIP